MSDFLDTLWKQDAHDAIVLDALESDPDDRIPLRQLCLMLGMNWGDFRRACFRLAMRQPGEDPRDRFYE